MHPQQRLPGRIVRQETPPASEKGMKSTTGSSWTEAILEEASSTFHSFNNDRENQMLDETTSVSSSSSYQDEIFDAVDLSLEEDEQNMSTIEIFEEVDLSKKEEEENLDQNALPENILTKIPLPAGDIGLAFQGTPPKVQLVTKDSPVPQVPIGCIVTSLNLSQDQVLDDLTTSSLVTALYEYRKSKNRTLVVLETPEVVVPAHYQRKDGKIESETCFSRICTLVGLSSNSSLPVSAI
eukprot:CAMPEP_0194235890 /NCGR_PEP_ID=MMETSP0158-20130606/3264_1 /TAXON_ID=33649 /ORGANISM="Thalassionema nitzschioides, Strain L26-B" /LENGTH=237 /DNA_ID=CAMNT_0038969485 /DNA_START=277 /DNA_END=990 /DNA_ORIENTATION=-